MAERHNKSERELVDLLRRKAQGYLRLPGVTSVGVGRKMQNGEYTDELCIQFTVERKLSPEGLMAENLTPLPEKIVDDDGTEIPIDVLERSFEASYEVLSEIPGETLEAERSPGQTRRSRLDPVVPGVSVSHIDGTAGTFGAVVKDRKTGQPYILSNWHVLHGPSGAVGDSVVQPGPFDDPDILNNDVGRLVRSHLGHAGDCAIASIEGRNFEQAILELGVVPRRIARVDLDDPVVKSGRTTGVTFGIVRRVGVVARINYGGSVGTRQIGGFEIGPNSAKLPPRGEISMGGDSGSLWLIDTDGNDQDVVAGLHFAGETDPRPSAEHAVACNIHSVMAKLKITF